VPFELLCHFIICQPLIVALCPWLLFRVPRLHTCRSIRFSSVLVQIFNSFPQVWVPCCCWSDQRSWIRGSQWYVLVALYNVLMIMPFILLNHFQEFMADKDNHTFLFTISCILTNTVFAIFCSMDSHVLRSPIQEAWKLGSHTRRSHDSEAHVW
jgi:hypothetical protein